MHIISIYLDKKYIPMYEKNLEYALAMIQEYAHATHWLPGSINGHQEP